MWAGLTDFLFFCQKKKKREGGEAQDEVEAFFLLTHHDDVFSSFLFDVRGGMMKKNEWIG